MKTNHILHGDARTQLARLPDNSIDCVVTSPPYFQLRDYGADDQIGLEDTVEGWVTELRQVFDDLGRVLKPSGSVWLNVGDSYSRGGRNQPPRKSLVLAPERLLLALSDDGWVVRNKVIWAKTNSMPSSVKDRLTNKHEYIYLLTRKANYFFDLDQIRQPHRSADRKTKAPLATVSYPPKDHAPPSWAGPLAGNNNGLGRMKRNGSVGHPLGKNPGDVWAMSTANFSGAHFATFPKHLVERPLLATCPERLCQTCDLPWKRSSHRQLGHLAVIGKLAPTCDCANGWKPGVVLDPFFGAGTVGIVAEEHNRRWVGIEISEEFIDLANQRIAAARAKWIEQQNGRAA